MKVIGIIVEVNPFHNGHKYFLDQIDKNDDDVLIAIVTTTITQRGEISVLSKKIKAQLLLDNKVDIVIALPSIFSNQGGYFFAYHSLRHLKLCNIDTLYFGSESGDLHLLTEKLNNMTLEHHERGIYKNLENLKSNDILGISYLKAIDELKMSLDVNIIKRINNNYNETSITGTISSATSIRNNIENKHLIEDTLPKLSYDNLIDVDNELLFKIFKNNLLLFRKDSNIFLSENNEILNKMYKYIRLDYDEFINNVADKNNSKNKINRIIINTCLNVEKEKYSEQINYVQVLGFTHKGQIYIKKCEDVNFVTTLKNENCYISEVENRATNLLKLVSNYNEDDDFSKPIIRRIDE